MFVGFADSRSRGAASHGTTCHPGNKPRRFSSCMSCGVISGVARAVNGENEFTIHVNESTYIPAGNKHRLTNPGKDTLVLIEVQSGNYLGEDDIVRFDDRYGRTSPKQ